MAWPDLVIVHGLVKPFIKGWEKFASKPYLCPANKWTIAWGITAYPPTGAKKVKPTDYPSGIPEDFANVCLTSAISRIEVEFCEGFGPIKGALIKHDPTAHQLAALISLAFNVGVGCHDGIRGDLADSTLLQKYNAGDLAGAAEQFLVWNKAHVDGALTVLNGLTNRRRAEKAMFEMEDA